MLKLKLLSGIVATTLIAGSIALIPFKAANFTGVINYIESSKITMTSANEFINKLENKNESLTNANNALTDKNDSLTKKIARDQDKINADQTTIANSASTIKKLENEIKKLKNDAHGYKPVTISSKALNAYKSIQFKITANQALLRQYPAMRNAYIGAQNNVILANYWANKIANPPAGWNPNNLAYAYKAEKSALNQLSTYEKQILHFLPYVQAHIDTINTINIPESERVILDSISLPSSIASTYNSLFQTNLGSDGIATILRTVSDWKTSYITEEYSYQYWTYLQNHPNPNWSNSEIAFLNKQAYIASSSAARLLNRLSTEVNQASVELQRAEERNAY